MVSKAVLKFLNDNNRPYSINDIINGINDGKFTRNDIQKVLNDLIDKEQIKEKVYGKQKIYFITQSKLSSNEIKEEIRSLDQQINQITRTIEKQSEILKTNTIKYEENKEKLTLHEIIEKKIKLEQECCNLKDLLKKYDGITPITTINVEEKTKIQNHYNNALKTYKKMKKLAMEMIDTISDNCPNKKIIEIIEIEKDEDVGFCLDKFLVKNE